MGLININETAYPRFKNNITEHELAEIYTPVEDEILFANKLSRGNMQKFYLLVNLKVFQRLGYFVKIKDIPLRIIEYIAKILFINMNNIDFKKYDSSNTRNNHIIAIRSFLKIKAYDNQAKHLVVKSIAEAAKAKEELSDLINVAIEELINHSYELPSFNTLVKLSKKTRYVIYNAYYNYVYEYLDGATKNKIDNLFEENEFNNDGTVWNNLKQDTGKPTTKNLKQIIDILEKIKSFNIEAGILSTIPNIKVKHFVTEAEALDAAKIKELKPQKRYTLAVAFISQKASCILDDIGEMFVKLVRSGQNKAREKQNEYRLKHSQTACDLIATLKDIIVAYRSDGNKEERFNAIDATIKTKEPPEDLINKCETHNTFASDNYYPFAWECLKGNRAALFKVLDIIELYSTTQDKSIELAIAVIKKYRTSHKLRYIPSEEFKEIDLSWISEKWTKLLTGHTGKVLNSDSLNRRYFEACVFYEIMQDLKSGDLCIKDSDKYSDYREQLISWEDYEEQIQLYGKQAGIPTTADDFINHAKLLLKNAADMADKSFLDNQYLKIKNKEPILSRITRKEKPQNFNLIKSLLAERIEQVTIPDILFASQYWCNWTKFFGPLSGYDSKIVEAVERYLITVFCYGCNLGPSQTANSLDTVTRKQISYIDQLHISEDMLDEAINLIINLYNNFNLIKYWGTGKSAAADGTIWSIYENNLLSENHIRYGGYGGIGYYHVSDLYIALFSRFIPCGVWEGVYILDILMNEHSKIKPNVLHSDTQGQNEPIFGLSFLLGIDLMPRIRNWKHLVFYKPDKNIVYNHIDELFSDTINWDVIKTHFPDMMRVALSIKLGKITPSTILRKLGSYSRKNKLYQAFKELGKVIRTAFLLKYISDVNLRSTIQGATNKNEAFNGFTKWLSFGNEGIIAENNRNKQRKIIKYNHLVANCVIFYNVYHMSIILQKLISEGYEISDELLASMSPYLTNHINRFGKYNIDKNKKIPEIDFNIKMFQTQHNYI